MCPIFERGEALRRLFDGLVEQVFMVELGICDPALTEYVGDMLADFVHMDRIYRLRTVDNTVIEELSHMEAQADLGPHLDETRRRRLIYKYMGDFTLFWTGVYPEQLRPRPGRPGRLDFYLQHGRRSYGIAGELTRADERPPAQVLLQLSEQFEYCVHGLHLVRAGWERIAKGPGHN